MTPQQSPAMNRMWTSVGVLGLLLLASLPFWCNSGIIFLVGLALTEAVFALSWNLLFGYAGLASFGHAGFYVIGAYSTGAALRYGWPVPFLVTILAAIAIGGAVAWVVGAIVLRRMSGIHLAVLTLALAEVLRISIGYSSFLGRDDGLSGIPRPKIGLGFVTIDLVPLNSYYWFLLLASAVLAAVLWWIVHSRTGRTLRAIRLDPARAEFLGIDVAGYRLAAFTISGAIAAGSGALAAPLTQIVSPDAGYWLHSSQPMLNTLLGGAGSFWGPVVGALAYAVIGYLTRTLAGLSEVVVGCILLTIILVAPSGLVGLGLQLTRQRSRPPSVPQPDAPLATAPRQNGIGP